jgi:rare lipoprotein A
LRYRVERPGHQPLRVRFAGDHTNAGVSSAAGRVVVLHQSLASWYEDGGTTACGFHAYYGVANLSLPCGARVTFRRAGRSVTATVDDRGPYVGGREWDLNQNTAAALGFGGVGSVWSSS